MCVKFCCEMVFLRVARLSGGACHPRKKWVFAHDPKCTVVSVHVSILLTCVSLEHYGGKEE